MTIILFCTFFFCMVSASSIFSLSSNSFLFIVFLFLFFPLLQENAPFPIWLTTEDGNTFITYKWRMKNTEMLILTMKIMVQFASCPKAAGAQWRETCLCRNRSQTRWRLQACGIFPRPQIIMYNFLEWWWYHQLCLMLIAC